jgi:hypothetical protein
MAWTDYSTTLPGDWSADIGEVRNSTGITYRPDLPPGILITNPNHDTGFINKVSSSYNILGFEGTGYQPDGVNDPINGDLGGGSGGGPVRPSSGFLYPRGQG